VLLLDQDRARWDHVLIRRGLAALRAPRRWGRAGAVRAAGRHRRLPRARAHRRETDWVRIAALYDALARSRRRRWWS
jgi:RNA polymerase sigma-70 factor (ECF subfamily)